jgi:hypothetical protein
VGTLHVLPSLGCIFVTLREGFVLPRVVSMVAYEGNICCNVLGGGAALAGG